MYFKILVKCIKVVSFDAMFVVYASAAKNNKPSKKNEELVFSLLEMPRFSFLNSFERFVFFVRH